MVLRERILRALYGGALVSAAALTVSACGDEPGPSSSNGWTVNNAQPDMSTIPDQSQPADQGSPLDQGLYPPDIGQPPADMAPSDQGVPDQNPPVDQGSPVDMEPSDQGRPDQNPPVDQGTPDSGTPDMQPDMPPADMAPDMAGGCIDPNINYSQLPYQDWQQDVGTINGTKVIVCGAQDSLGSCKEAKDYTDAEFATFLANSLGVPQGCSGEPEPVISQGGSWCGPLNVSRSQCCYAVDISFSFCAVGRPFTVDGEVRLADVMRRDGWCESMHLDGVEALSPELRQEIAAAWAENGTHEHASVASFGRFLMDLMSLGAPLDLVKATTKAIDDEIRHARDCFSIASTYAGFQLGPDVVDVSGSMDHAGNEAIILRDAILEGCIGETLAASVAQWMTPRAMHAPVREILQGISQDEGDHAVLAWEFVSWMLATRPHLIEVARETFASVKVSLEGTWAWGMDVTEEVALAHGRVRPATEEQLRLRAYIEVVKPCADTLFAQFDAIQPAVSADA